MVSPNNIDQIDKILKFNEKVSGKLIFSQINSTNQHLFIRVVGLVLYIIFNYMYLLDATEQFYGGIEKEKEVLQKKIGELQREVSSLRSKNHGDCYSFAGSVPEDEEEVTESIENVTRLEKQNAILKEKNAMLQKTNQEYKKRLEAMTKGLN
jgi:peptidoglycan hydrolase CwlO-like protein